MVAKFQHLETLLSAASHVNLWTTSSSLPEVKLGQAMSIKLRMEVTEHLNVDEDTANIRNYDECNLRKQRAALLERFNCTTGDLFVNESATPICSDSQTTIQELTILSSSSRQSWALSASSYTTEVSPLVLTMGTSKCHLRIHNSRKNLDTYHLQQIWDFPQGFFLQWQFGVQLNFQI